MADEAAQRLKAAIRRAAGSQGWSQGSMLARAGAAVVAESGDDEIVCRVTPPTQAVALEVVLYPEDGEWECSCPSRGAACSHVAAAIIAATDEDGALPAANLQRVHYVFRRRSRGLALDRLLGDERQPLTSTLTAIISGRVPGPKLTIDPRDIEIDRMIGKGRSGILSPEVARKLLRELSGESSVWLEDKRVETDTDAIVPVARLRDSSNGVVLRIESPADMLEAIGSGLALSKGPRLRPIAPSTLAGKDHENLPFEKEYPAHMLGELATEVVPELAKEMLIDNQSAKLPGVTRDEPPWIHFEIEHTGLGLEVLPTLVYGNPPIARIDGTRVVQLDLEAPAPVRDQVEEERLRTKLRNQLNLSIGRRLRVAGRDAQVLANGLRQWHGTDVASELLVPSFDAANQGDIRFRAPGGSKSASGATVLAAWRSGLDVVPLDGGGLATIPKDWLDQHGHLVADLLTARERSEGELPNYAARAVLDLCDAIGDPPPPKFSRLASMLDDFERIPRFPVPAELEGVLRPYQQRGVDWLAWSREAELGAVLADDMGLGKTLQALAIVERRCLVVCPTSVAWNWAAEAAKFRPSLRVSVYHGAKRELDEVNHLTITTYALLRRDRGKLCEREWDMVILDEAQNIKNPDSQAARAAYDLRADFKLAMTGTPVENRLEELWSLIHFVCPGLLGGLRDFKSTFSEPIESGDKAAAAKLHRKIAPFILRREKEAVAPELPPRTDAILYCELDDTERRAYESVWLASQADVVRELQHGKGVMAALEALLRLRQAACHAGLLPGRNDPSSTKVERLVAALQEACADGHKALVFSQWTSLLDRVEPHLVASDLRFSRLDGSTRDRASVIDEFQRKDGPPILLISLKAGGTGLTLTAADHVFLLDPWWNPAVEDQAKDRAHRIGQDKPVMVYRLVSKDTVEEGILRLQDRKRELARAALEGRDVTTALTKDDLLELFAG